MKSSIHLIGNAHLDPAWLWPWYEGMSEARATFSSALERIEEFPEFIFTASAASLYQWIGKTAPDLLENIKKQVRAKRWSVPGGWHTQSDDNIPSGESFARNALYSQNYFEETFGIMSKAGYTVDTFGHAGSLPQLLIQGGMDAFIFMRPGYSENPDIPCGPFIWEGTDGSRVLCYRLISGYNGSHINHVKHQVEHIRNMNPPIGMIFYGVGDHGGGPTKALLREIEKLKKKEKDIHYSDPDRFFKELLKHIDKLPVWKGEMQHHAPGCYQAHSGIKRSYRRAVHSLITAEKLKVLACPGKKPDPRIEAAWKDILFSDFHDIMGGTCERKACDDTLRQLGRAEFTAQEIIHEAVQITGSQINTSGKGRALLMFNPHAFPFKGVVETDDIFIHPAFHDMEGMNITDPTGKVIPHQPVPESTKTWSIRLAFQAELPPLGYKLYRLNVQERDSSLPWHTKGSLPPSNVQPKRGSLKVSKTGMSNDHISLSVNKKGHIQITDRKSKWKCFSSPAAIPLVIDDPSDTWSHGVSSYDKKAGEFRLKSTEVIEKGPLRGKLRLIFTFGTSELILDYSIERESANVTCNCVLDWHEHQKMLKFIYPVHIKNPIWTSTVPYGTIGRPLDGKEYPIQEWTDLSDRDRGVSICNTGSYSADARDNSLRITALRSPVYAHHDPIPAEGQVWFQDQGIQEFSFSIITHEKNWKAETFRQSQLLNCSPVLSWEGTHKGRLGKDSKAGIETSKDNILITSIKPAEKGSGLIVRAIETAGKKTDVQISFPFINRTWSADFHKGEVKTFLIPKNRKEKVKEVNFLER